MRLDLLDFIEAACRAGFEPTVMRQIPEICVALREALRERDEARAELALSMAAWESAGMPGKDAQKVMLDLSSQLEKARADIRRLRNEVATEQSRAYQKGAEDMRAACMQECREQAHTESMLECIEHIRALPIPEKMP